MKYMILVWAATAALNVQAASKLTAEDLSRKMIQNAYSQSEQSVYVMRLTSAEGSESVRKMKLWFKRGGESQAKLLIKFQEPADIRGTALLSVTDSARTDQWLYLPKLKKTRRIKGGNESESFLGSDFTVGDLTSVDNDKDRYTYTLTAEGKKCGDSLCHILTGTPKASVDASELPYSKKIIEVRADNFMSSRIEFFNAEGTLEKVMELKGIHKAGSGWVADRMEMKNILTNHSTVIEVTSRDSSVIPTDSLFTQNQLEKN